LTTPHHYLQPELSNFYLDLHRSLADQGFAKNLDRSTGMPVFFAKPSPSRFRHTSSGKIAQFRFKIFKPTSQPKTAATGDVRTTVRTHAWLCVNPNRFRKPPDHCLTLMRHQPPFAVVVF